MNHQPPLHRSLCNINPELVDISQPSDNAVGRVIFDTRKCPTRSALKYRSGNPKRGPTWGSNLGVRTQTITPNIHHKLPNERHQHDEEQRHCYASASKCCAYGTQEVKDSNTVASTVVMRRDMMGRDAPDK
jgi:hypothetical protein